MHCHKRERLCLIMVINYIKYCMKNRHYFSTHACIMVHWVKHLTSGRSRALEVTLDEGKSAKGLISWPTKNSQSHNWHFVRSCLLLTNCTLSRMHTVRFWAYEANFVNPTRSTPTKWQCQEVWGTVLQIWL